MANVKNTNLELWNSWGKTPDKFRKEMKFGARLTSIDTYFRFKLATEKWGSYGSKWGVKDEKFEIIEMKDNTVCLFTGILFYPEGEFPIHSDIELKQPLKDWSKKVVSDALTKGLSMLGMCADIFLGEFVDDRYTDNGNGNTNTKQATTSKPALIPIPKAETKNKPAATSKNDKSKAHDIILNIKYQTDRLGITEYEHPIDIVKVSEYLFDNNLCI